MNTSAYTLTVGAVARQAETCPATVRLYGDRGLLDFVTASDGTRLHGPDAPGRVREIKRVRLLNRGGARRRA